MKSFINIADYLFTGKAFRRLLLVIVLLTSLQFNLFAQLVGGASRIYTDYDGYWDSSVGALNSTKPGNSHNLLGFTWDGITYSTGVNDDQLDLSGVIFTAAEYQAFPVSNILSSDGTYIGLGQLKDGVNNGLSDPPPFAVPPNLANFLTDGLKGLDIGTGVANVRAGELISDFIGIADITQIADGIPDILLSQVADANSVLDEIYFTDQNGNQVGESIAIDHTSINEVGVWTPDFYNLDGSPSPFINVDREIRLWVAELSAFGITIENYDQVKSMRYNLKGSSDPAFIAFKLGVFDVFTANNDEEETNLDEEVRIDVLENDQPVVMLDPSSINITSDPSNGTVSIIDMVTGNITYTPGSGFLGTDEFTYEVCSNDPEYFLCDEAVVMIRVSVILPIVLLDFSATLESGNQVLIKWTTSVEKANDFFEVQRSHNGLDWEIIQKVEGAGNSTENVQYTITDQNPETGYNYYRLKQVDINGHFELFQVVSVKVQNDRRDGLWIYPNPSQGLITVEGTQLELGQITVVSPIGEIQNKYLEFTRISDHKILIHLEILPSGMYIIKTRTMGKIIRKF